MSELVSYLGYGLEFFAAFFVVTNPIGTIPLFIGLTSNLYPQDRNRVNLYMLITTVTIILVSLAIGNYILAFFGVSIDAFRIAGGIMIAKVAFSMLAGGVAVERQNKQEKEEMKQNVVESSSNFSPASIAVVPLGIPIMAGPATISTAIVWGGKVTEIWQGIVIVLSLAIYFLLIFTMYFVSPIINRVLGTTGLNVLTRVIGLFMLALGVQFVITALTNIARSMNLIS